MVAREPGDPFDRLRRLGPALVEAWSTADARDRWRRLRALVEGAVKLAVEHGLPELADPPLAAILAPERARLEAWCATGHGDVRDHADRAAALRSSPGSTTSSPRTGRGRTAGASSA